MGIFKKLFRMLAGLPEEIQEQEAQEVKECAVEDGKTERPTRSLEEIMSGFHEAVEMIKAAPPLFKREKEEPPRKKKRTPQDIYKIDFAYCLHEFPDSFIAGTIEKVREVKVLKNKPDEFITLWLKSFMPVFAAQMLPRVMKAEAGMYYMAMILADKFGEIPDLPEECT